MPSSTWRKAKRLACPSSCQSFFSSNCERARRNSTAACLSLAYSFARCVVQACADENEFMQREVPRLFEALRRRLAEAQRSLDAEAAATSRETPVRERATRPGGARDILR